MNGGFGVGLCGATPFGSRFDVPELPEAIALKFEFEDRTLIFEFEDRLLIFEFGERE